MPRQPKLPPVRYVGPAAVLRWLRRGWHDLWANPLPGLAHGLSVAAFGALLLLLARDRFWLLAGAFSGFLLVAPMAACGLYAVSRARAQGRRETLAGIVALWRGRDPRLVRFGLLLALAGTGWVLTSAALITRFAAEPVATPADFLRVVVLARGDLLFETWLLLGAALAAPIFASTVVTVPLLLDRAITVKDAVLTSALAALASPAAMALWATLILGLTLLGMATAMLGLVLVVPWLAHASWHAYRDLVGPDTGPGDAAATH